MERDDEKDDRQHRIISRNTSAHTSPNSTQTMALHMYERPFHPTITTTRESYRRLPTDQQYAQYDSGHVYPEQPIPLYHLPSSSMLQGAQSAFSLLSDNERPQQYSLTQEHNNFTPHHFGPVLPPVQHSSLFGTTSQFHPRHTTIVGPSYGVYSGTPYLPSNDQITNRLEASSTLFAPSNSSNLDYGTSPVSRSDSIELANQPIQDSYRRSYAIPNPQPSQRQVTLTYLPSTQLDHQQAAPNTQPQQTQLEQQDELQAGFLRFEDWLKAAFDTISTGHLHDASNYLLLASNWLVASVVPLELHYDEVSDYERRLHMWADFNHCWEALAQKQKTITESGHHTSNRLTVERIREIVTELIGLCDQAEKHGLVDYEMGIWEDQIVDAFIVCLDLLEQQHEQE